MLSTSCDNHIYIISTWLKYINTYVYSSHHTPLRHVRSLDDQHFEKSKTVPIVIAWRTNKESNSELHIYMLEQNTIAKNIWLSATFNWRSLLCEFVVRVCDFFFVRSRDCVMLRREPFKHVRYVPFVHINYYDWENIFLRGTEYQKL